MKRKVIVRNVKPRHPWLDKMQWWHIVVGAVLTMISTIVLVMTAIGFTGETTGKRLTELESRVDAVEHKVTKNSVLAQGLARIECKSNDLADRANANMAGVCTQSRDTMP